MRQAIGTTWIMILVFIFLLIFVAFLSMTINYTKAFKIKNELVSMIEKYEGIGSGDTKGAMQIIDNYLIYNNYTIKGTCSEGEYGITNLANHAYEEAKNGNKYYYCVKKINRAKSNTPDRAKYQVRIFFKFTLPVLGELFTFSVEGTTVDINNAINDIEAN